MRYGKLLPAFGILASVLVHAPAAMAQENAASSTSLRVGTDQPVVRDGMTEMTLAQLAGSADRQSALDQRFEGEQPSPLRRAIEDPQIPTAVEPQLTRKQGKTLVMPAMYVGLATLQALDAHSTLRAIDAGHAEGNPLMGWVVDHPVAFVSIKGAATAGTILVAEKIRKKYPKRALAFMAAINTAYALVVAHNYRASSR
jgi:hypothetical protein